jgi:two-component system sensor histidine kinase CiaH
MNSKNMMGIIQKMEGNSKVNQSSTTDISVGGTNLQDSSSIETSMSSSTDKPNIPTDFNASNDEMKYSKPAMQKSEEINPRIVYIIRNTSGNITQQNPQSSDFTNVDFDSSNIETIYMMTINSQYKYRGITHKIEQNGETYYVQVLINVDAEENIMKNFSITLVVTLIVSMAISILASYILSKKTLSPIISSWKKQTEFVQNASHELRTPLTIIQAKQELLLDEPDSKIIDKAEDIGITLEETRRLSKLVKDLMELARADSNKTQINKEKVDVDKLIAQVAEPFEEMAKLADKKIELKLNYKKDLEIDKNKIHEVLVIILDNSMKYTEKGDTITISTTEKDGKLVLDIADTGIGISDEGINHVFERFYREDKARSRETGGSGLGLSLANTIIQEHGGTIRAMHNNPKGTIIEIKIK